MKHIFVLALKIKDANGVTIAQAEYGVRAETFAGAVQTVIKAVRADYPDFHTLAVWDTSTFSEELPFYWQHFPVVVKC